MVKRVGDGSERQKQAKQPQKKEKKNQKNQMLSICKVNSQFKGISNDTLKIRSKMQKCATTNI